MYLGGIDYSTHNVDLVLLPLKGQDGKGAKWFRVPLRDPSIHATRQAFFAARTLRTLLVPAVPWEQVAAVYVEEPIYLKRNASTVIKLARIQGAILSCLPPSIAVDEVHPSTWKQGLGLAPNADKMTVKRRALELGFDAVRPDEEIQDCYDAFCIGYHMRAENDRALESMPIAF